MAKQLKKIFDPGVDEIVQDFIIESWHVSQSVDAFRGDDDYDITISGSLTISGSTFISGSPTATGAGYSTLVLNNTTGQVYVTGSYGGGGGSGTSGTSGSGSSGTSGTSGSPGSSGGPGIPGSSGTSGSNGSSGTSGSPGSSGTSGSSGVSVLNSVHSVTAGSTASPTIITNSSTPSLDDINGGTLIVYQGASNPAGLRFGFSAASYTKDFNCTIINPGMVLPSSTSGDSAYKLEFSATPFGAQTYTKVTTGVGSGGGYKFNSSYSAGGTTFTGYKDLEAGGILRVSYSYDNNLMVFHGNPLEL